MHKSVLVTLASLAIGVTSALAQDPTPQAQKTEDQEKTIFEKSKQTSTIATIQDIDHDTRHMTLKTPEGDTIRVKVSDQVPNFDQLKKGDKTAVDYYESVAFSVVRSDEPAPPPTRSELLVVPKDSPNPEKLSVATLQVTATVEHVDAANHKLTVKGPRGNTMTINVDPDVKDLNQLKVGDHIVTTLTEAIAIAAKPANE